MLLQITIFYLPLFTKIGGPLSVQVHLSLWACKLGCDPGGWALLTFARFNRQFNRKSEESCDSAMTSWQEYQRIHWVLLDHLKPFKTSCSLTEMNTAFWWLSTTSEGCFFFFSPNFGNICAVSDLQQQKHSEKVDGCSRAQRQQERLFQCKRSNGEI